MYLNISCICYNNTATHLKFGQQLYWIYTEGKSLIMKLGPGLRFSLHYLTTFPYINYIHQR